MNIASSQIIPLSKARSRLGNLTETVKGNQFIILTKGGAAKAALVDIDYLIKLQETVSKIYQRTFIDPKLLPYTREFTDQEIKDWLAEDKLP